MTDAESSDGNKLTMTEAEFCRALGVARQTVWRMRKAGRLSYLKIGGSVRYLPRHLEEFLASCEHNGSEKRATGTE